MEIIKRGIAPGERFYVMGCSECRSTLKAKQDEGKITYDQKDRDFIIFICPVCDTSISKGVNDYLKQGT